LPEGVFCQKCSIIVRLTGMSLRIFLVILTKPELSDKHYVVANETRKALGQS